MPHDRLTICLVTPAPAHSRSGNRVTALRWASLLRDLGHRVAVDDAYQDRRCDVLVALHARKSFAAVERFRRRHPTGALVVALTGTDLYADLHTDPRTVQAMEMASRLVLLQPIGLDELPAPLRGRARVIYQSVPTPQGMVHPAPGVFGVCVLAHLRAVKDPFRAALAARLLPARSRVRIVHAGAALSDDMARQARAEMQRNPRYRWVGALPRWRALRLLARSRVRVLSSYMEGGANAVSEALAASVPVLASRIPGSIGLLGAAYPGYFPLEDTRALADLLAHAETDIRFYETLTAWVNGLRPLVDPARERSAWAALLRELTAAPRAPVTVG